MPKENREINFSETELKIALMQFSARKGVKFTVENITEFNLNTKDTISVTMKVFDVNSGKAGTINYSNPEIAAAMMGYCMFLKIPLPKSGKKFVLAGEDGLSLNIKIQ